jgi:hypothetical protein
MEKQKGIRRIGRKRYGKKCKIADTWIVETMVPVRTRRVPVEPMRWLARESQHS